MTHIGPLNGLPIACTLTPTAGKAQIEVYQFGQNKPMFQTILTPGEPATGAGHDLQSQQSAFLQVDHRHEAGCAGLVLGLRRGFAAAGGAQAARLVQRGDDLCAAGLLQRGAGLLQQHAGIGRMARAQRHADVHLQPPGEARGDLLAHRHQAADRWIAGNQCQELVRAAEREAVGMAAHRQQLMRELVAQRLGFGPAGAGRPGQHRDADAHQREGRATPADRGHRLAEPVEKQVTVRQTGAGIDQAQMTQRRVMVLLLQRPVFHHHDAQLIHEVKVPAVSG